MSLAQFAQTAHIYKNVLEIQYRVRNNHLDNKIIDAMIHVNLDGRIRTQNEWDKLGKLGEEEGKDYAGESPHQKTNHVLDKYAHSQTWLVESKFKINLFT